MSYHWVKFECRDVEEADHISDLLQRNRRLEEQIHMQVMHGYADLRDSDILIDALHSNLSILHTVIRLLKEKAG